MRTLIQPCLTQDIFEKFCISKKEFKFLNRYESGTYGISYNATHLRTKRNVVLKQLFLIDNDYEKMIYICSEIIFLMRARGLFLSTPIGFIFSRPISIITEEIPRGSLYNALNSNDINLKLTPTEKTKIAIGICYGMMKLHKLQIVHGDLKSHNILLTEDKLPLITDFGILNISQTFNTNLRGRLNSPYWFAPELFENPIVTQKSDVFSFGIILYEMLKDDNNEKIEFNNNGILYDRFEKPEISKDINPFFISLLNSCWLRNPNERPNFKQIYKLFKFHYVYFEGSDILEITNFFKFIKKHRKSNYCKFNHLNNINFPNRGKLKDIIRNHLKKIPINQSNDAINQIYKRKFLKLPKQSPQKVIEPLLNVKKPKKNFSQEFHIKFCGFPSDTITITFQRSFNFNLFLSKGLSKIDKLLNNNSKDKNISPNYSLRKTKSYSNLLTQLFTLKNKTSNINNNKLNLPKINSLPSSKKLNLIGLNSSVLTKLTPKNKFNLLNNIKSPSKMINNLGN